MPNRHRSRHGSKQFWPRRRAKKLTARVRSWSDQKGKILGFAGYKAGMTHILFRDVRTNSPSKGELVNYAATIIECPPLKIMGLRFYQKDAYGSHALAQITPKSSDKHLKRKLTLPKKEKETKGVPEHFSEIRFLVHTQPSKTSIGKKRPEIFEIYAGGKEELAFAQEQVGKEIKLSDVFKTGEMIDTHSVTKGKGFQGAVKRFGVFLREHKSEKKVRAVVIGPQSPRKVLWGMLMPGQMGTHLRTDYNKEILLVDHRSEKINPEGGFVRYGLVKNEYLLIKGSVPGPKKRLITLTKPIRKTKAKQALAIEHIHTGPQQ